MKIWIIDHYSVPVKYYPLARNTNFARHLLQMGHEVVIFAASTVHNSKINLITGKERYLEIIEDEVRYVLVKCHQYRGNGVKRIINMYEFAAKLEGVCDCFSKPDVILSTSMTLFACKKGIRLAQKYACKKVAQITDLWPETLVAYGKASSKHPLVRWFRKLEKWIYANADRIIFSMEGAYDYIVEQGWETEIPKSKVFYINNGVELEQFDKNCREFQIRDTDLDNEDIVKIIYTGSIRTVNNIDSLIDVAKHISNPKIKILIWGDGDQLHRLKERIEIEDVNNVVFKGKVEKKYVPFITSKASINIAHNAPSSLFRFGISFNKIFDYFGAGKPVLTDFPCKYNPVIKMSAGFSVEYSEPKEIAKTIMDAAAMDKQIYERYCNNAREAAKKYDFNNLTKMLIEVLSYEKQ